MDEIRDEINQAEALNAHAKRLSQAMTVAMTENDTRAVAALSKEYRATLDALTALKHEAEEEEATIIASPKPVTQTTAPSEGARIFHLGGI